MVIPRDYSPLTRWERSNNLPPSNNCNNNRDRCRHQGLRHLLGNLRFRRKLSLHLRLPLLPNFHLALTLVLQILLPNIDCNGPRLHLRPRLNCQVGWYSVSNSFLSSTTCCILSVFISRFFFSLIIIVSTFITFQITYIVDRTGCDIFFYAIVKCKIMLLIFANRWIVKEFVNNF